MQEIRNGNNKLVCRIDRAQRIVEIVLKGCTTQIQFADNGKITVTNSDAA